MRESRIERDSMGAVEVPATARWGAQTQRAVQNFPVSGQRVDREVVVALAAIKRFAALENARLGVVGDDVAQAIATAATEVESGLWDEHFPVDVFQTGSGTSTNMNVNEVLANLAAERLGRSVHPNDHVNASQSSNDAFPSAVHVAAARVVSRDLAPSLSHLASALRGGQQRFASLVKAGRTHLMDAAPVTLGQEFGGWAQAVENGRERVLATLPRVCELPLGGTAVGTGLNAPAGFAAAVVAALAAELGLPLREAPDHFEAQGARDALVEVSGALRAVAVSLFKICNDLRLLASGPYTGLAEIRLPDLQPGSSIMPGKVNPVIPEAVCQVAAQVLGNDTAVAFAGASGTLELNVMIPVMSRNVLESARLLSSAAVLLADRCVAGIEADEDRCRRHAESSPAAAAALNPHIGYERAAEAVKQAVATGRPVRDVVLENRWMTAEELDAALDVLALTRGGLAGPAGGAG